MSSRININRPAPAYSPQPQAFAMGGGINNGHSGSFDASAESPFEKLRVLGSQIEDQIDTLSQPLRPYLPAIGRFLIVVTFLEDALRIVTQWSDQLWYLQKYVDGLGHNITDTVGSSCYSSRHRSFPWGVSHVFLMINVLVGYWFSRPYLLQSFTPDPNIPPFPRLCSSAQELSSANDSPNSPSADFSVLSSFKVSVMGSFSISISSFETFRLLAA